MYEIWFLFEDEVHSMKCTDVGTIAMIWDTLNADARYTMRSKRP
jgi:hypothetical protein